MVKHTSIWAAVFSLIAITHADGDINTICSDSKNLGTLVCITNTTFAICIDDQAPIPQSVAEGTTCVDGRIEAANPFIAPMLQDSQPGNDGIATITSPTASAAEPITSTVIVFSTRGQKTETAIVKVDDHGSAWTTVTES